MNNGWQLLSVTTSAAALSGMAASALMLALPSIMVEFHVNLIYTLWIILSYLIALVSVLTIIGAITDRIGRANTFRLGVIIFTIFSLILGFSPSPLFIIIFRVFQAVGAGFIMTNSSAMVTEVFSNRGNLGFALSINQIAVSAGFAIGPIIGGILTELSWRWVFWYNVPIGIAILLWSRGKLHGIPESKNPSRIDWIGALTFSIIITYASLVLTIFPLFNLSSYVYYISIIVIALLIVFLLLTERRSANAIFDPQLFSNRPFSISMTVNLLNGIATGSLIFLLTLIFQGPYGMSPLKAAFYMIPFAASWSLISPLSGKLADRGNAPVIAAAGLLLVAAGMWMLSTVALSTTPLLLSAYMAIVGIGAGMFNSPNNKFIMNIPPPHKRGLTSGTMSLFRNFGSILSFSLLIPVILNFVPLSSLLSIFIFGGGAPAGLLLKFMIGIKYAAMVAAITATIAIPLSVFRGKINKQ
ncbi:MAG: MFS transporter [Nitrososphaerota archaeon]|jgi:MFS family permease|nr:MFS transporter [Nitrososphaerota archaeon]MDG6931568.1 MFS transporter [Nitrososphaerota archaeon]MDG6936015.1 MFS transporter [Nitrososphaerota archaeon]MDG6943931.1 MFS transporter [Nitrososphaerota archaeon]